nr:zinc finger protein 117 isoform X1 [Onthophagus taurus]
MDTAKCRSCLSESDQMHDLFQVIEENISLALIIENFLKIKLNKNDNLSQQICLECTQTIINFYNFSITFEENNNKIEYPTDGAPVNVTFDFESEPKKDSQFMQITDLKNEKLIKQKYICEICGFISNKNSYLKAHMETHSEPQFSCEFCPKIFRRRTILIRHRRLHTEPRRYICENCGLKFNDPSTLKQHKTLIHLRPNNFECVICKQTFSLKSTLDKHIKRHSHKDGIVKEFVCDECGMEYYDKSSLKRHFLIKHN